MQKVCEIWSSAAFFSQEQAGAAAAQRLCSCCDHDRDGHGSSKAKQVIDLCNGVLAEACVSYYWEFQATPFLAAKSLAIVLGSCLSWKGSFREARKLQTALKKGKPCMLPSSIDTMQTNAFKMFKHSIVSCESHARAPIPVSTGASRARRATVQCRGLYGQQASQHSWPLRLGSAGIGLAAAAFLSSASPAGMRSSSLQALFAVDDACRHLMESQCIIGQRAFSQQHSSAAQIVHWSCSGLNQDWRVYRFRIPVQGLC